MSEMQEGGRLAMNPEEQVEIPQQISIDQVIQAYMQYALTVQGDQILHIDKKSQAMLQMAQALSYLVPLATNDSEAELAMKQQEHDMTLQQKQAEIEFKHQEHLMKMQQADDKHRQGLMMQQQKSQQAGVNKNDKTN
jgi:hypothetical protein